LVFGISGSDTVAAFCQRDERKVPVSSPTNQLAFVILVATQDASLSQLHERPVRRSRRNSVPRSDCFYR
jgi:hypothetical protein